MTDEDLQNLQESLTRRPEAGTVERGTGGLRKVRFAQVGQGKSGAYRVGYLPVFERGEIVLLVIYSKVRTESLTASQKAALRSLTAKIKKGSDW